MIIAPLIMLPNKRTANASVRDSSPMRLNGSIRDCRFDIGFQNSCPGLFSATPNIGTAANTQSASAAVVESEPVGGS